MFRRMGVVWALVTWVSLTEVWAAPAKIPVADLKVEHREGAPLDIISNLPSATNDMLIWNGPGGSYRFGMQGLDQWRVEARDADGNVEGRYVYKTPDGQTVDVSYDSGPQGYRARGDAIPGGAAPPLTEDVGSTRIGDESVLSYSSDNQPYGGALLKKDQEVQFPTGYGISTHTNTHAGGVITEVRTPSKYSSPKTIFPLVNIPGTDEYFAGPPLVNKKPLLPAAIPV